MNFTQVCFTFAFILCLAFALGPPGTPIAVDHHEMVKAQSIDIVPAVPAASDQGYILYAALASENAKPVTAIGQVGDPLCIPERVERSVAADQTATGNRRTARAESRALRWRA